METIKPLVSITSMQLAIERNKKIIDDTKDWSPELQMRIEQTHVLEVMVEALTDLDK